MALATILGWAIVAGGAIVAISQATGFSYGRHLIAAQTLTPHLAVVMAATTVAMIVVGATAVAIGAAATTVALAVVVAVILVRHSPARSQHVDGDAPTIRVFAGNLLDDNRDPPATAAAIADVAAACDVLALVEFTRLHASALDDAGLGRAFVHRRDRPAEDALGTAVWTRQAVDHLATEPMRAASVAVRLAASFPVVVHATHPTSPIVSPTSWRTELAVLSTPPTEPTVLVGDFNATIWHPPFRRLLAAGWTDAHLAVGDRWSGSWNRLWRWIPPFAQLDHALVSNTVDVVAVDNVELPGSDHRGLVVTITPRRR